MAILLRDMEPQSRGRLTGNAHIQKCRIPPARPKHVEGHQEETAHHVQAWIFKAPGQSSLLRSREAFDCVSQVLRP